MFRLDLMRIVGFLAKIADFGALEKLSGYVLILQDFDRLIKEGAGTFVSRGRMPGTLGAKEKLRMKK